MTPPSATPERPRLAILVDGENVSQAHAGRIVSKSIPFGDPVVMRVYGNAVLITAWDAAPRFRLVHSGTGKNATDLLLTVEAMALAYSGRIDSFCIVSSDRDYIHLVEHLREKVHRTIGMGEAKAPEGYRKAFGSWVSLEEKAPASVFAPGKPAMLEERIAAILRENGGSFAIHLLNGKMRSQHQVKISELPEKSWRAYLTHRKDRFHCDPRGPDAKVHLV